MVSGLTAERKKFGRGLECKLCRLKDARRRRRRRRCRNVTSSRMANGNRHLFTCEVHGKCVRKI